MTLTLIDPTESATTSVAPPSQPVRNDRRSFFLLSVATAPFAVLAAIYAPPYIDRVLQFALMIYRMRPNF